MPAFRKKSPVLNVLVVAAVRGMGEGDDGDRDLESTVVFFHDYLGDV